MSCIPVTVAELRDRITEFRAIVHASAASAVLDLDSEGAEKQHEEYGKTLGQAKFLTSDTPSCTVCK